MNPEILKMVQGFMQGVAGRSQVGVSPWAINEKAISASIQLTRQIRSEDGEKHPVGLSRRGSSLASGSFARRIENIAIVPVLGPLMSRMNWAYWSYDEIIRDLRLAAQADGIVATLLDVDSPGGMVANVDNVVAEINRLQAVMPVHAHIGGLGASAAYWISSAADAVSVERTGLVGSVGALIRYLDIEGIFTKLGANVVEVIADQSPNKRLSTDSEEGQAELQAIVNHGAELFIEGLVRQRGVSRETVLERYGQGLVFDASAALERGLVDEIASFEEILAKLADRQGSIETAASAAVHATMENPMTGKTESAATEKPLTVEGLKASNPELIAAITAVGQKTERDRIAGIEEQAKGLTGHDDLVAEMKGDGKTTPAEAAVRLLAAEKAKPKNDKANLEERLKGLEKLDQAAEGIESRPSETGTEADGQTFAQTPEGWKAEWEAKEDLQERFPTAEAYVATMKRDAAKRAA